MRGSRLAAVAKCDLISFTYAKWVAVKLLLSDFFTGNFL